ncbi:unnamed protein product [Oncorhynchus mykiss]|uniref:Nucleoporin Nup133/Nup155-like C-terminal domain-containing protein n=1 Tax=Oncorhynchus mykiss TaxID=8022 RepID=A0A060XEZ5_ONCMY|nr:unnamed protein product [Oncorhynchus mykiss]
MKGVSFKDVVIRGRVLTGALITGLINVYIKDFASVDAISTHLRDICPLLYSSDDSICSKANELLQGSRQIQTRTDKERTLRVTTALPADQPSHRPATGLLPVLTGNFPLTLDHANITLNAYCVDGC